MYTHSCYSSILQQHKVYSVTFSHSKAVYIQNPQTSNNGGRDKNLDFYFGVFTSFESIYHTFSIFFPLCHIVMYTIFGCNAISNMLEDVLIDGIYGGLLLLYHVHDVMDTFNLMKGALIL